MELLNATGMQAGYTMGTRPDGRELLVVAIKGTFTIPPIRQQVTLADEQKVLVEADSFTGEPGFSAPLYEVDFAPVKPMCDVLLNGSAYAPGGKAVTRVEVTLRVASMFKSFAVTGNRTWEAGKLAISPGYPGLFESMPITYDTAFGGVDNFHENERKHSAWMTNPVGCGYHKQLAQELVDGSPMPNTEELRRPISMPNGTYAPMAFGPLGRGWDPRRELAGTYDQEWIDNNFPFLPPDFKEAYYQAAPVDQQIPYLQGGERVFLENLTPEGQTTFDLPQIEMPVVFFYKNGEQLQQRAVIDTLVLEPDEGVFTLTWRVALPLKKSMFEISQVLAGRKPRGWWRARRLGKTYYPSLADLVADKQATGEA
ncbi:MAG: hypothetical protein B6D70_14145 [gamma proteobacterium symbiont of Stewartia floridana]|nr:DUF2169 domain-containing protein [Candidatus Thiodiazotropha taylori]RLW53968.1 MAG: hypothetical protein B6D76_09785 [gamma proteobacterium symbiont of Stewartia floridana]MCG7960776.1 DUF2169 domain-containing protein [Candidatus Thiodiazotropha taylori]MCG7995077.1 DUF2169 domain-containing protein [Candidatus Thiodiazotropha taylori]MCG8073192.1 DUF2169 domain-containing protein [Candidatus Thiodiazotropha taylori]